MSTAGRLQLRRRRLTRLPAVLLAGVVSLVWTGFAPTVAAQAPSNGLRQPSALDREVDAAVAKATAWLARQQQPSGGWRADLYDGDTTSMTSLAMMSLLAAGYVPGDEPYAATFRRGLQYLSQRQQPSGLIVDRTGHGPLYCHGITTLFLAEVVGLAEPDQAVMVRQMLEKAVRALLEAQAVRKGPTHAGGWRYTLSSNDSDLSVSAWQLLALRAARNAGCDVPADAIDRAVAYVRACGQRGDGFRYQPGGGGASPIMTAAGVTALQVCGATDVPEFEPAIRSLARQLPRPSERYYLYGTYYGSVSLHQYGGDLWEGVRGDLFRGVLGQQSPDGSWLAENGSERSVGRVYATSLAVLALTVEYGYLPIYQK